MSNAAQMPVEMKTRIVTGFPAPANLYARFKSDDPNEAPAYDRVEALVIKELTWLGDTRCAHELDGFLWRGLVGEVSNFDGFEFRGPDNPEGAAIAAALAEGFAKIEKAINGLAEAVNALKGAA